MRAFRSQSSACPPRLRVGTHRRSWTATSTATSYPPRSESSVTAASLQSASRSWADRNCCRQSPFQRQSARAPGLRIIWGGAFPTVCPEATVNAPYVDYAVRSQGEETLAQLLDALTTRQPE